MKAHNTQTTYTQYKKLREKHKQFITKSYENYKVLGRQLRDK